MVSPRYATADEALKATCELVGMTIERFDPDETDIYIWKHLFKEDPPTEGWYQVSWRKKNMTRRQERLLDKIYRSIGKFKKSLC